MVAGSSIDGTTRAAVNIRGRQDGKSKVTCPSDNRLSGPRPTLVQLTEIQIRAAHQLGVGRHLRHIERGLVHTNGLGGDWTWDMEIEGACAEEAVATLLELHNPFSLDAEKTQPDIPPFEVRWTKWRPTERTGFLVITNRDELEYPFTLVTGRAPNMTVIGWAYGWEAEKYGELKSLDGRRPPTWNLHHSQLHRFRDYDKDRWTMN